MKNQKLLLALRNGINKLTGKQELIDQYRDIVSDLSKKHDRMESGVKKTELAKKLDKLTEATAELDGKGGLYLDGFDPYRASKKVLKQKIAEGQKLRQQAGISR